MRKLTVAVVTIGSCILLSQTGCLLSHSDHVVVRQAEPLRPVSFESEQTKIAYETYIESALQNDANKSSSSFGIPFIVGLERSKTVAPNAIRNDVAVRTDINKDGLISDYEMSLLR